MINPLLTIAIPTYNRSDFLDTCLAQLHSQVLKYKDSIELIVCDNASSDNTCNVVAKYISKGTQIRYIVNECNIGADLNIAKCFKIAGGKYVLIFGDDDILVDGALDKIIALIRDQEYGVVYLNSYVFLSDFVCEKPKKQPTGVRCYTSHKDFINRENYWLTFISGNIVNKSRVSANLDIDSFAATNLVQLSWTLSALFGSGQNLYINDFLVGVRGANSGGYKLCEVFGKNINKVFDRFVAEGTEKKYFDSINNKLLFTFFPYNIISVRKHSTGFIPEDFYKELFPIYSHNLYFWLFTMPVIKLPLILSKRWVSCIKLLHRLSAVRHANGDKRAYL